MAMGRFPSAPGPSAVSGRTEHARIFDSLQSELPVSVAPRSTSAPVGPWCTLHLAFGSSNRPMCVLAPKKCAGVHGRAQKLCCLIAMLSMQPCRALKAAHSPCGRGLRPPSKFFSDFWGQVRFSGAARGSRAPTNAHSSSKDRSSCAAHVLLRSCRWIPGACIFKVHMY